MCVYLIGIDKMCENGKYCWLYKLGDVVNISVIVVVVVVVVVAIIIIIVYTKYNNNKI